MTAVEVQPPPPAYDLDQLGWLQFERLCSLVLEAEAGLTELGWIGRADKTRVAAFEDRLVLPSSGISWPGPTTFAAVWIRDESPHPSSSRDFAQRLALMTAARRLGDDDRLLVLTNLDADQAHQAVADLRSAAFPPVVILGAGELARSLDRHPGLRAALPSVLGLRDLTPLIDPTAVERSCFDLDGAQALARVFSPTRSFDRARGVLDRHRFVVLTGPPEMGKTAIARMIALAKLTDGWEAHETDSPVQVWSAFDPDRRQVFIADDAFGSTEYRPDAAERWAHELARLLPVLDDRHWLIWTSRPAPLKAGLRRVQRERGSERFPAPGEVLVDAGDLDLAEKTLILFRHAKSLHGGPAVRRLVRSTGPRIVEHPHFTPERIRRLISDRRAELLELAAAADQTRAGDTGESPRAGDRRPTTAPAGPAPPPSHRWRQLIDRELTTPTDAMSTSFGALDPEHRNLLIAMLDVPAGFVDDRALAATLRHHHPGGLPTHPGNLVDRLTDHFIRVTPLGIDWVHPSWRDLVIDQLRAAPAERRRFLRLCGLHGAMLALSQAGGPAGLRTFPLLLTDPDWDVLTDRVRQLVCKLEDQDLARLLLAIGDALSDRAPPAVRAEAISLADCALGSARRAWDDEHRVLPLTLLEAWYAVNARLAKAVAPPRVEATWYELHPRSGSIPGRPALARADEWLALAQLLDRRDPRALTALGFPAREGPALADLIRCAEATVGSHDDALRALAESVLARIRTLAPAYSSASLSARARLELDAAAGRDHWWTPSDLDAPPTDELAAGSREHFESGDITRVLRDL